MPASEQEKENRRLAFVVLASVAVALAADFCLAGLAEDWILIAVAFWMALPLLYGLLRLLRRRARLFW